MDIAARVHPICLAELFGAGLLVVMRCAQGGEPLERRKCLGRRTLLATLSRDWNSVVDNFCGPNLPVLQTCFAKRMLSKFQKP